MPGVHDYRQPYVTAPSAEVTAGLAWRPTDADDACTFMAECTTDLDGEAAVVPILAHLNIRAHTTMLVNFRKLCSFMTKLPKWRNGSRPTKKLPVICAAPFRY